MTLINRFTPLLHSSAKKIGHQNGTKLNPSQLLTRPLTRDLVKFSGPEKNSELDPVAVAFHKKRVQKFLARFHKDLERLHGPLSPTEQSAQQFIAEHIKKDEHDETIKKIPELDRESLERQWDTHCQGDEHIQPGQAKTNEDRETDARQALKYYYKKPKALAEINRLLAVAANEKTFNPLILQQLKILHKDFKDAGKSEALLEKENELIERTNELKNHYNRYCAKVDGIKLSDFEVAQRLEETDDPVEAKNLWKMIAKRGLVDVNSGGVTLVEGLVELRNDVARENGYKNYFSMKLAESGVDEEMLEDLMKETEEETHEAYQAYKKVSNQFSEYY